MDYIDYKLRVGGFNELSTIDSDGVGFAIFFQGCSIRCKGCHNPELQPFAGGGLYDPMELVGKIVEFRDWYDNVVLLGGEPLDQPLLSLVFFIVQVKKLGLGVWLYTGYSEDKIPTEIKNLCTVIVAGAYIDELRTDGFPASSNQIVIDNRRKQYELFNKDLQQIFQISLQEK
jgi:anaerobic ribonucleoside-triphosphate reductase activating protein